MAFGVAIPDLPGCFSAGDTLDEALLNAGEAAVAWIETVLDDGGMVPGPSSLAHVQTSPEFQGWAFGFIEVHPDLLDDTSERVDIVLPRRVLKRLDSIAAAAGTTRSAAVAELTVRRLARAGDQ